MATTQWPQHYQQYQQQPQHYQQPQQYAQGQQYQQPQSYQHNLQYQVQQYPQLQQSQPFQQNDPPPKSHSTQQYQHQPQGYPMQQHQQHQQNQQYQAQLYQQPQQSPPVQQYPQRQPDQPQQGHIGYQYQYAPPQYHSQLYPPRQQGSPPQHGSPPVHSSPQQPVVSQQHGASHNVIYQQACQPQPNSAHTQTLAQTAPQPCFNCGNSGHFAMDCPEPIRDVPAGKLNPHAFQNPLRRPKTGGTVVSQNQYTPHPSHAHLSPKAFPPPYGQMGYTQHPHYQQVHSLATPHSAHSPAQTQHHQQWPQYYQYQQAYQQGNQQHQGSPYHQQPHTAPYGQATGYSNGSQTSIQAPIQAPQYTDSTQTYQSHLISASATPVHFNPQASSNNAMAQPDQQTRSSISMNPQSSSPSSHKAQVLNYNFEEDNLDSLDVPDLPQTTLHFPNASQQPVSLIGQPLPGNFVVADALAPFAQPAPEDEGCCRSKYQYRASLEACLERFKNSKYWDKEHADDVVFSDLLADDKIVPVDEMLSTIRQRRAHPESGNEFNRDSRSQSRTVPMSHDCLEMRTTLDRMERELAETKAKLQAKLDKGRTANQLHASPTSVKSEQPTLRSYEIKNEHQTPPQSAALEKPVKSEQDAENVLAALGVTGVPKPVTENTWPIQYTAHDSPHEMHMSRSRSSSGADIDQHRVQAEASQVAPEPQTNGSISRSQPLGSLPPPPMLFRQRSNSDEENRSPRSGGIAFANSSGYNTNGIDQNKSDGNGFSSPPTEGQAPSPIETRSEKSVSRKRHRDSSSDEEDTFKRRQEDDYTPKLKKRQPKVAEAYSRRW